MPKDTPSKKRSADFAEVDANDDAKRSVDPNAESVIEAIRRLTFAPGTPPTKPDPTKTRKQRSHFSMPLTPAQSLKRSADNIPTGAIETTGPSLPPDGPRRKAAEAALARQASQPDPYAHHAKRRL